MKGMSTGQKWSIDSLVKDIQELQKYPMSHSFKRRHGVRHCSEIKHGF